MAHPKRKKSAREHQAAVELASKRRQLAKLLKKEGYDPVPLDKRPKILVEEDEAEAPQSIVPKSREEREQERAQKLAERKKRAALLLKKTRKGQPIMKNVVQNLVSKLSKE